MTCPQPPTSQSTTDLPNAQNDYFVDLDTLSDRADPDISRAGKAHCDVVFDKSNEPEPGPEAQICTCSTKILKQYPRVFRNGTSLHIRNEGRKLAESCKKEAVL